MSHKFAGNTPYNRRNPLEVDFLAAVLKPVSIQLFARILAPRCSNSTLADAFLMHAAAGVARLATSPGVCGVKTSKGRREARQSSDKGSCIDPMDGLKRSGFGGDADNSLDRSGDERHSTDPRIPISQGGETMTRSLSHFDRLVASVDRIARYTSYPGIEQTLDRCLDDIDTLRQAEQITPEQREALRLIVLGVSLHAA
jgi:hypothetical protein